MWNILTQKLCECVCVKCNTYGTILNHSINIEQLNYCSHLLYAEYVCFLDANENHYRLLEFYFFVHFTVFVRSDSARNQRILWHHSFERTTPKILAQSTNSHHDHSIKIDTQYKKIKHEQIAASPFVVCLSWCNMYPMLFQIEANCHTSHIYRTKWCTFNMIFFYISSLCYEW